MTQDKHTPGPWLRNPTDPRKVIRVAGFSMRHFSKNCGGEEAEANAHLIAAAPDMLKALKTIVAASNCSSSRAIARAALAKARGEST